VDLSWLYFAMIFPLLSGMILRNGYRLYSRYYEKFPACKAAISKCSDETITTQKSDLDSLLSLRFQLFQKAQFVTV